MYEQYSQVIRFGELDDPRDVWELVERIGEGTYGEVHAARHKDTGQLVAVKIMESIQEVIEEIEEEYLVLRDLAATHLNLPDFYGLFLKQDPQADDQLWFAIELCSGGSVTDLIKARIANDETTDETTIAYILHETMKALHHLHTNKVIHRDIKGHNILLTSAATVKLVDFGVSGHLKGSLGRRNTSVGTPFWMAPEVIACEQQLDYDYDVRCDVWSLGVTAIELADGEPPMADLHPMRALFKIPRNPPPTVLQPDKWTEDFNDFIAKCVIKDFEKRPFVKELFDHPFIKKLPEDSEEIDQIKEKLIEMVKETGKILHEPYVTTKHGKLRMNRKSKRTPISAIDDLATLDNLEEDVIVEELHRQYDKERIYTYMGDILLAVNPFTPLVLYTDEHSKKYRNACKADNPPHIFAIADQSYQAMTHQRHNQCIVISGESGSGKTESANFLVQQLTLLGRAPNRHLEDKILLVNPLVEAFGNAKTVINGNSSRFGKYLEMTFTDNGKVTGARLTEYLLEKSRVIQQSGCERNFHIFYYLHDGLSAEDKTGKYHLAEYSSYRYLNQLDRDVSSQSINRVKFKTIQRCFETIGFKTQEVNAVYNVLVGILHTGNIMFAEKEERHQTVCTVENPLLLDIVAELLGIDPREFKDALTTSGMVARGETIVKHHTIAEAVDVRDAVSKAMYGRIFSWIVNKINILLKPSKKKAEYEDFSVGILDIFGFENFERNSFEQMCINVANEQIQYYFNQHIFAWEQQEYKNEGVDCTEVTFIDNRPVLDMLLSKPMGMLALLDEESHFPQATDMTLVEKFGQNINSPYLSIPKSQGLKFTIEHYAGKVEYNARNFLEKNRDRLAGEMVSVLRLSQISLVRNLFHSPISKTGNLAYNSLNSTTYASVTTTPSSSVGSITRSASNPSSTSSTQSRSLQTVATYFRFSLMDLLSKMVTGTPHFVRCIRPNIENSPGYFDDEKVRMQLRYTGVLETTRIRRQGFSHRIPFSEFLKRYYILGFNFNEKVRVNEESCILLLNRVKLTNWKIGKSKVFLKYYHIEQLSRAYEEQQRRIIVTQAAVRRWLQRRQYLKKKAAMQESAATIQRVIRGYLARLHIRPIRQRRKTAAERIQALFRGHRQRILYKKMRSDFTTSAVTIQAAVRGFLARERIRRIKMAEQEECKEAAVVLQKYFRMWKAQADYVNHLMFMNKENAKEKVLFNSETPLSSTSSSLRASPLPAHRNLLDMPLPPGHSSPFLPLLSQERQQQIQKIHELKTPWTEQDATYYDSINGRGLGSSVRKDKMKNITSPEEESYYDSFIDQSEKRGNQNKMGDIYDLHLRSLENQPLSPSEADGDGFRQQLSAMDGMFRTAMAATAATKFMMNKPVGGDGTGLSPGDGPIHKSDSNQSLQWDDVLERAREEALAPDRITVHGGSSMKPASNCSISDSPLSSVLSSAISSRASARSSSDYEYPDGAPAYTALSQAMFYRRICAILRRHDPNVALPDYHKLHPHYPRTVADPIPVLSYDDAFEMHSDISSSVRSLSPLAVPQLPNSASADKDVLAPHSIPCDQLDDLPLPPDDLLEDIYSECTTPEPSFSDYVNMIEIPAPPSEAPPPIPARRRTGYKRHKRKHVRFSDAEDGEPDGDTSDDYEPMFTWVAASDKQRLTAPDTVSRRPPPPPPLVAGMADIQITSHIEEDGVTYKEEFIMEQVSKQKELVHNLELQRKNSLSHRFQRRQRIEQEQLEMERRWKQVQELKETPEIEEGRAFKRILSRDSSRDTVSSPFSTSLPSTEDAQNNNDNNEASPDGRVLSRSASLMESGSDSSSTITAGYDSRNEDDEEMETARGKFDYRSVLKKNRDPTSRSQASSLNAEPAETTLVNYRAALKKRFIDSSEQTNKKHVIYES